MLTDTDLSTKSRIKKYWMIGLLAAINTFFYPLTIGTIPRGPEGTLDYSRGFSSSFTLFFISFIVIGFIIGTAIALFTKNKKNHYKGRRVDISLKTILVIESIFAFSELVDLIRAFV